MDWNKGYSSSFYMMEIDPVTWRDTERIDILSGSISRGLDGLRHTATVECINYPQDKERWVRIYMDTRQSDSGAHTALFTGIATSPDKDITGESSSHSLQCYSPLKMIDDIYLKRGWYAMSGVACTTIFEELLAPLYAPYTFGSDPPSLQTMIVAEDGETYLTMIDKILVSVNWNLKIMGDGTIYIGPYNEEPVSQFDPLSYDILETDLSVSSDWYSCPNVFMAINGDATAIARDEDSDTPLSIQNRGREVWMYETNCTLNQYETLDDYASRRLSEEQSYISQIGYDRRYVPDILPADSVILHYPAQGVSGTFTIISQSIELGYNARTSEEVIGVLE